MASIVRFHEVHPEPAAGPLRKAWRFLTEPVPTIVSQEDRRRARLLSAMLVVLIPVTFLATLILPYLSPEQPPLHRDPVLLMGLAVDFLGLGAYLLSRTRHFHLAAGSAVLLFIFGTWASVILSRGTIHEVPAPYFLALSVLVSSIFLRIEYTVLLAFLNMAALLFLPVLAPAFRDYDIANPLTFLIFHAAFIFMLAVVRHQDLRQMQQQTHVLKDSEEMWRSLAENAPDQIVMIDRTGKILFANQNLASLTREQVVGTSLYDYVEPSERSRLETVVRETFETGGRRSYEIRGIGATGPVWYASHMGAVREDDWVVAAIVVSQEVTERKQAEEARAHALQQEREMEQLKQVARLKTDFINAAAHELSTPLTPILVQAHMLRRTGVDTWTPAQRNSFGILDRNLQRLAALLNDVLDGARIQSSRLRVDRRRTDLESIIREAVDSHQAVAHQGGHTVEEDIRGPLWIEADPRRLSQVLDNLLSNAVKFTPSGGRIRVEAVSEQGQAVVRVSDTGLGLTPGQVQRLFEPFTQFHDVSQRTAAGTGLGLYISKGIVEAHGGRIWAESPGPERGATFSFTLPLASESVLPPVSAPMPGSPA